MRTGLNMTDGIDDMSPTYIRSPAFSPLPAERFPPWNYILDNGSYVGCTLESDPDFFDLVQNIYRA